LLKPDALVRGLVGSIVSKFEAKGLKVIGLKMLPPDRKRLEQLYAMHRDKPFYSGLLVFMRKGPTIAIALKGPSAVAVVRSLVGATDFVQALPGTIRGDLAMSTRKNLIHAADSPQRAEEEIRMLFKGEEIIEWDSPLSEYLY